MYMKESTKSINELIDYITQTNVFYPVNNPDESGLSPDLSDDDINKIIESSGATDEANGRCV